MVGRPPRSPLFPYTTLFRSRGHRAVRHESARLPVPPRDRDSAAELASGGAGFPLYGRRARRHAGPRELEPRLGLEARAGARGRSGAGDGVRDDAPQAGATPRRGQHSLQPAAARPDRAAQPGHREGERGPAPAGAGHRGPGTTSDAQVSRAALGALLLALALRPAAGQLVTVGPQFALADYREVASGLRYRGSGFGGSLWPRRDRLCGEAAGVLLRLDPSDGSAATTGFTATQVDAWAAYDVAAYASVEVVVLHRSADPEFDAQSVGAVRVGARSFYEIGPGATVVFRT